MNQSRRVIEIRKALLDIGVSQAQIGRELGVTKAYVCGVIRGGYGFRGKRSDRVRRAIAERIGRTIEEFWPEDENEKGQADSDAPTSGEGESCQGGALSDPVSLESYSSSQKV